MLALFAATFTLLRLPGELRLSSAEASAVIIDHSHKLKRFWSSPWGTVECVNRATRKPLGNSGQFDYKLRL